MVTIICNWRDYTDEENNDVLSFCEKNEITLNLIDNQNPSCVEVPHDSLINSLLMNEQKYLLVDDDVFPFRDFYFVLEKKFSSKTAKGGMQCVSCGKTMECSVHLKKCFECLLCNSFITDTSDHTVNVSGNSNSFTLSDSRSTNSTVSFGRVEKGLNSSLTPTKKKNPYNFIEKLKLKHKVHALPSDEKDHNNPFKGVEKEDEFI